MKTTINLIPLNKKMEVICTQRPVQLSAERQNEIEEFWTEINKDGKFYRGDFSAQKMEITRYYIFSR